MTESEISDIQDKRSKAFGEALRQERVKRELTVQEVSQVTNLSVEIIDAIDASDLSRLPPPTYVQGYIRIYARYLDLPAEALIEEFCDIVPHSQETSLRPREPGKVEQNSNTPVIRGVSYALIAIGIFAFIYVAFTYYSDKAKVIEESSHETEVDLPLTLEQEFSPGEPLQVEDPETQLVSNELSDLTVSSGEAEEITLTTEADNNINLQQNVIVDQVVEDKNEEVDAQKDEVIDAQVTAQAPGDDILNVSTGNESSWTEVLDSNNNRLFYGLLGKGENVVLKGTAPFDVFLGNASTVTLLINNQSMQIDHLVRSNKIARFKVSVDRDNQVVFQ